MPKNLRRALAALLLLPLLTAGAADFDLLPPPAYADLSPYQMTVPLLPPLETLSLNGPFGWRCHPITGALDFHTGADLAAAQGTLIRAVLSGTVREAGFDPSYGNYLRIDHHNGFSTLYAHCSRLLVKEGDAVRKGQRVAKAGSTGDATGPHLHLEVWMNGVCLDPAVALKLPDA